MFKNETVRVIQFKIVPGKIKKNAQAMMTQIEYAQRDKIGVLIFPACSLTGGDVGSYLYQEEFWQEALYWREKVIQHAQNLILIFGDAICENRILTKISVVSKNGQVLSPCSDDFYSLQKGEIGFHLLQSGDLPPKIHSENLVYLANHVYQKEEISKVDPSLENAFPYRLWVNSVGIEDNGGIVRVYSGASSFHQKNQPEAQIAPYFEEAVITFSARAPFQTLEKPKKIALLYSALCFSAKYYLEHLGLSKIVIGLSGGIDSALSACIYRSILPPENLYFVNMPSQFNSGTTKGIAAHIADHCKAWYGVMPIEEAVQSTISQFQLSTFARPGEEEVTIHLSELNIENLQARIRSNRILASIASAIGGVFTCNANKSESAVGYGTLCGDDAGFFGLIGDLWKNEIYELAIYIQTLPNFQSVFPEELFTTPPSAELSAKQNVDEGLGDPIHYAYHDRLFSAFCELVPNATPYTILKWYNEDTLSDHLGVSNDLIHHLFSTRESFILDLEYWWRQYTGLAVAKRIQASPVLSLSSRTFGSFPESQISWTPTHAYEELKTAVLKKGD